MAWRQQYDAHGLGCQGYAYSTYGNLLAGKGARNFGKNEEILRKFLNFPKKLDWKKRIFPQLSKSWPTWEEDDSRIIQKGVRAEYLKQLERSNKAKKSAEARWNGEKYKASSDENASSKHMLGACLAGEEEIEEGYKDLNNNSFSGKFPNRELMEKPDVQPSITHYEFEYQRIFNKIPMVFSAKDTQKLRPVVEKYGVNETSRMITRYLKIDDDKLIAERGWPLCLFPSAINRILVDQARESPNEKPPKKVQPPPGVDPALAEKWEKCLEEIQSQIRPENFETLFEPMAFAGIDNSKAKIICPSKQYRDCVLENYDGLVEGIMSSVFGEPVKPVFSLDSV